MWMHRQAKPAIMHLLYALNVKYVKKIVKSTAMMKFLGQSSRT